MKRPARKAGKNVVTSSATEISNKRSAAPATPQPVRKLPIRVSARAIAQFTAAYHPSAAEVQILELLAAGFTHKQIARKLGRGVGTVNTHCDRLHKRVGVKNSAELMAVVFVSPRGRQRRRKK